MEVLQEAVREVLGEGTRAVVVCAGRRTVAPAEPAAGNNLTSNGAADRRKQLIQSAIDLFKGTLVTE